jgi:hypothetical protein
MINKSSNTTWPEKQAVSIAEGSGEGKLPQYPRDHQVGMKVPKGGSECAKCEYLKDNRKHCGNDKWVKWFGSSLIPAPIDEYCCDFFEAK